MARNEQYFKAEGTNQSKDKVTHLKTGFTMLSNEIFEEIPKRNLNVTQLRVLMIIWRYTYGFHRKAHTFSLTFLAEALCVHKNQISKCLKELIEKNVLIEVKGFDNRIARLLAFNENLDEWLIDKRTVPKQYINSRVNDYSNSRVSQKNNPRVNNLSDQEIKDLNKQNKYVKENDETILY